jgi:hypothetical protein
MYPALAERVAEGKNLSLGQEDLTLLTSQTIRAAIQHGTLRKGTLTADVEVPGKVYRITCRDVKLGPEGSKKLRYNGKPTTGTRIQGFEVSETALLQLVPVELPRDADGITEWNYNQLGKTIDSGDGKRLAGEMAIARPVSEPGLFDRLRAEWKLLDE